MKLIDHTKYASVVDQTVIEFQKSKSSSNSTATSSFKVSSKVIPYHPCIDLQQTQFIGEHNNSNLSAVFQLLKEVTEGELSLDKYYDLIRDVKPLAHRCQYVMEIDGIQIIDDLHATGAHAQRAALRSVHDKLILICGGFDKGDDYSIVSHEYETTVAG